jgi:hypothetical protein
MLTYQVDQFDEPSVLTDNEFLKHDDANTDGNDTEGEMGL